MKYCSRCGAENREDSRFCTHCGAPLEMSNGQQPPYTNDSQPFYGQAQSRPNYYAYGWQEPTYFRNFQSAVHTCLVDKYARFSGRATRSEYWFFYLFNLLATFGIFLINLPFLCFGDEYLFLGILVILYILYLIGMIVPNLSVGVRRLHDSGKSGWFMLFSLIPYVGGIIYFIFCLLGSDPYDNQYGLAPHEER